jgi:hypothetical protein
VWAAILAAGGSGLNVVSGVPVTAHPAHRHVAGGLTRDGREYDDVPAVGYPATVDAARVNAQQVRHEIAHDWHRALGEPVAPTFAAPGSWATSYERGDSREYAAELVARVWGRLSVDPAERDWVVFLGGDGGG